MSQNTIQDLLNQLQTDALKAPQDIPIKNLLQFWIRITGLEWTDALESSAARLWADLSRAHTGLVSYITVMGDKVSQEDLREAACRLIGKFILRGSDLDEERYFQGEIPITFEQGVWVYYSDPKLRIRNTKPTFHEAVLEARLLLAPNTD